MGLKTYDEGKEPSFPSNYDVIQRTTLNFTDIVGTGEVMMIMVGSDFNRRDPVFDGTQKSALKLIKKVFQKLPKYSSKELSNTSVGGLWENGKKIKGNRIWLMIPSITALQTMRLAYYFQTETYNILLSPDFNISPNCDQCWWNVEILKPNSTKWEWKP